MYTYLKKHPDIFMSENKEPYFFGKDLQFRYTRMTERKYLNLFKNVRNEKIIGEASTSYLYSKDAAQEIKEFSSHARIIIMLRNPVDMLYSYHSQILYLGNEDISDFEQALKAEEDRKSGRRIPKESRSFSSFLYREKVKFTEQVKRYFDIFGRERVHIILFDDFVRDTAKVFRETLEFLGVNSDFQPKFKIVNPNSRVKSKLFRRVIRGYATRFVARHLFSRKIRRKGYGFLSGLNTVTEDRPPLNPMLKLRLQRDFAPEVRSLSTLIGRDLTKWLPDGN